MKEHSLPKATQEELDKKAYYENKAKKGLLSDVEDLDYCEFMNSINWDAEFFKENGKYGILSVLDKMLVPPHYEDFVCFLNSVEYLNVVAALKNGKWGLVAADGSCTELTEFQYDYIAPIMGPKVVVMKDDKWGYLGMDGQPFTSIDYDGITIEEGGQTFVNGISMFRKEGRIGVTNGISISLPIFDEIDDIDLDQWITGTRDGKKGYITEEGEFTEDVNEAWWCAQD